jgi:GNAT superfamily N-acetyltransferase
MENLIIRALDPTDKDWVNSFIKSRWNDYFVVSRGVIHFPADLPGFIAIENNEHIGLITYNLVNKDCEIVTLDSLHENSGIGTKLILEVIDIAQKNGCEKIWLVTTNDNTRAIDFYRNRGFGICAVHKNALQKSRKLKPSIPQMGINGIPIEDEIEFEYRLK